VDHQLTDLLGRGNRGEHRTGVADQGFDELLAGGRVVTGDLRLARP